MRVGGTSLVSQCLILLWLFAGVRPAIMPLQPDSLAPQKSELVLPNRHIEILAGTALSEKDRSSKPIPGGPAIEESLTLEPGTSALTISAKDCGSEPAVLSYSHNRSPPFVSL